MICGVVDGVFDRLGARFARLWNGVMFVGEER